MSEPKMDEGSEPGGLSRRALIATSAGVATTAVVTLASPSAAAAIGLGEPARVPVTRPATPIPADPIVAYVHDAGRGEVTIVAGKRERTYRDPALARRLIAAAQAGGIK